MAVVIELTAKRYEDIVANVEITVPLYAFDPDTVYVYYGLASLEAVRNVDFTVELAPDQFNTFVLTPTTSLLTKINALIALDPTETNFITVRRSLDYKTATTPDAVRYTPFTSSEFDNIALRFQQVAEQLSRTVTLPLTFVGDEALTLPAPEANRTLAWNAEATGLKNGPTIAEIETVAGLTDQINTLAPIAAQIVGVDLIRDEVVIVGNGMGAVVTVVNAIAAVNVVAVGIDNVEIVANDITAVLLAAANMAAILAAPQAALDAIAAKEATEDVAADFALAGEAAGTIKMRFGALLPGFIAWGEGGTFNRATYPGLAAWLDVNGAELGLTAPQIASGTIPDWRDYSPRTAGGALGPAVGAKQGDNLPDLFAAISTDAYNKIKAVPSWLSTNGFNIATNNAIVINSTTGIDILRSSASDETRVKTFGVRWQIKAAGAVADLGTINIMALGAQVTDNTNRIAALEAIGKPFTKEYVSAEQTITTAGLLTLAHGLGAIPKKVSMELVCQVADGGYAIGDIIEVSAGTFYGTTSSSASVRKDATNVYIRYGNNTGVFIYPNGTGGVGTTLGNANWRLVVRAWA